jgi:hypothetical protein
VLPPTLTSINPTTVTAGGQDFTLAATGTNFVSGTILLWGGNALPTTVTSATQLTAKVNALQIASAANVTIRAMKPDGTTSDAITLTVTGTSASAFGLTSISPSAIAAGSPTFTLTAIGIGFVSGSFITLNGTAITTVFDSNTQLHASVAASVVAAAGTINIAVSNPDFTSTNSLPFTVVSAGGGSPAPTLTSLSPNTSTNGVSAPITLTANGTNFVNGSVVLWNGTAMVTQFVSSTQLTAAIPAAYINVPSNYFDPESGVATAGVFVLNPDLTISNQLPFTITVTPKAIPRLDSVSNPAGTNRSLVGDPGFALTLNGIFFVPGATAYFGNLALPTTVVSPFQATAQVPASALTSAAQVPVTIQNAQSQKSNQIPYYVGLNIYSDEGSDVVWDSRFNLLYVSKPSTASHNADTVMAFSPSQLTDAAAIWIYQLPRGSNPDRLAMSADGAYLYVGLDGAGAVQQLTLTSASTGPTKGNTISLGSDPVYGPYYPMDLQVSPLSNSTIAVARGLLPSQSNLPTLALGGVALYDNGTQKPQVVGPSAAPSGDALLDTLQWSADGNTIYAANNENASGDLYQLPVTATGVTLPSGDDHAGIFNIPNLFIHLDAATGLLYGDDGTVIDPAAVTVKGNALANGVMTPDHASNTAFFVAQPSHATNPVEYLVLSFSMDPANFLAAGPSLDLYQVSGIPQHLIRWNNSSDGSTGLAFTTKKFGCPYTPCTVGDGRLYIIYLPL